MRLSHSFACAVVCLGIFSSETLMAETIHFTIADKTYPIVMADNADARHFIERLPFTVTFENFGTKERVAYPEPRLKAEEAVRRFDIPKGTITIYKPWGTIAVFKVDFDWHPDLALLGQLTDEGLQAICNSADLPVTFSR